MTPSHPAGLHGAAKAPPPLARPGRLSLRRLARGRIAALGLAAAAGLALLGALAFGVDSQRLEGWLAPLGALSRPFVDLAVASRGGDGPEGAEYVVFLQDGAPAERLTAYAREHATVSYVSPGLFSGVHVVRLRGDVQNALAEIHRQPYVRMVLKSRLGMVCH